MTEGRLTPSSRLSACLQVITVTVVIAYPLVVWLGLKTWGESVLAPVLVMIFILRLLTFRGKLTQLTTLGRTVAITGIALGSASWLLHETQMLLYYPVVVNALLLLLFGYSLFVSPPIVERLARLSQPDLPPRGVKYTRRVTQVWCAFFIINGSIALFTCLFGDIAVWTLYNGGISYLLIGLLMGIEWTVRRWIQRV
ncbi:hypothetical protein [Serratia sp. M24T3]|uniref:COG4648 family protein n=1 Tax=Serratia sp. M24T3 TaxID=932213 RepID=UPI00025B91B7|nr:hypothetical protein [Serratia sp. M24T3]EIC83210.1 inner membrane protein [Serratia sp. M24T3]